MATTRYRCLCCWYGLALGAMAVLSGTPARGQSCPDPCTEIHFEHEGPQLYDPIDTQYQWFQNAPGVVFSRGPGPDCGSLPQIFGFPVYPGDHTHGKNPPDGQVLGWYSHHDPNCCVEISFVNPTKYVRFYLSQYCAAPNCPPPGFTVTATYVNPYQQASQQVTPPCYQIVGGGSIPAWVEVCFFSNDEPPSCEIAKVEICASECFSEVLCAMDDLGWGIEGQAGDVTITDPGHSQGNVSCDGFLDVHGWSCDPDACSYSDELYIRRWDPLPRGCPGPTWSWGTWCHVKSMTGCRGTIGVPGGWLYTILPTDLPALDYPEAIYELEIRGRSECGKMDDDQVTFCLDRYDPNAAITCPVYAPPGQPLMIVGGYLPICGSVTDTCGVGSWQVAVTDPPCVPFGQSVIIGSGAGSPPSPLAYWNTFGASSCGPYTIDLVGTDLCNRSTAAQSVQVIVDNEYPVAEIDMADSCPPSPYICFSNGVVIWGIAYDLNIAVWELDVSIGGGPFQYLAAGNTNVGTPGNPGILHIWDTCPADACCYTLRLMVMDKTYTCCPATWAPNTSVDFECGNLGQRGDYDGNGVVDFDDINAFVWEFSHPCPCPCPPCADCPAGGIQEAEPCGSDTNGGCNMATPAFEPIACGQTICGTSYWDVWIQTRDTDWFVININNPETFTVTAMADFDVQVLVLADPPNNVCDDHYVVDYDHAGMCPDAATVTTPLLAGRYYIWVGPQFNFARNVACTNDCNRYWVTLNCVPSPTPPDGSWPAADASAAWDDTPAVPADVTWRAVP